jgi:hypothetical protein
VGRPVTPVSSGPQVRHPIFSRVLARSMASAEERGSALSEIEVSGPALTGGTKATIELSASGTGRARFPIGDYGKYDATARTTASDGGVANGSGSATVTSAAGTCPPP